MTLEITDVLAVNNGELKTGSAVEKAKVEAVVVVDGTGVNRDKKVVIYKKRRRKKSYRFGYIWKWRRYDVIKNNSKGRIN